MSWNKTQRKSWEMFLCIKVTCTIHNHLKFASCALTESLHVVDKFVTFLRQSNLWAGAQRSVHDTGKMSYCQLSFHSVLKENQTIKCIRTVNQKSTRLSTNQTCLQTSSFSNVLGLCDIIWPSLLRVVRIGWQFDQDKVKHVLKHRISTPYVFFPSGSVKSPLSGVSRSAYVFK